MKLHLKNEEDESCETFTKNFENILSFLKSGDRTTSLLIIIEELDLFLQHEKQILIYNLLNAVQSTGTPIFVLGTTTRLVIAHRCELQINNRGNFPGLH